MKTKLIFVLIIFFVFINNKIYAQEKDRFYELESIFIDETIDLSFLKTGKKVDSNITLDANTDLYIFPSESFEHPQQIQVAGNKVIYISLYIPVTKKDSYNNLFKSLGSPEITQKKAETEILFGFPSKGVAFVSQDGKTVQQIIKFPIKTTTNFEKSEGKNYQPVQQVQQLTQKPTNTFDFSFKNPIILDSAIVIFLLICVGFVVLIIKRKKNSGGPPDLPPIHQDFINHYEDS